MKLANKIRDSSNTLSLNYRGIKRALRLQIMSPAFLCQILLLVWIKNSGYGGQRRKFGGATLIQKTLGQTAELMPCLFFILIIASTLKLKKRPFAERQIEIQCHDSMFLFHWRTLNAEIVEHSGWKYWGWNTLLPGITTHNVKWPFSCFSVSSQGVAIKLNPKISLSYPSLKGKGYVGK